METIVRAAYFLPCFCKGHGAIICTGGEASYCDSKNGAYAAMGYMKERGWISEDEILELGRQVYDSSLPSLSNSTGICDSMWEIRKYAVHRPSKEPWTKATSKSPPPRSTVVGRTEVPLH